MKLPQMGESVAEATLTNWLKEVGDTIEMDEAVFEIATDKVDSEVPSEVDGVLLEKRFNEDDVIKVGEVVAVIQVEGEVDSTADESSEAETVEEEPAKVQAKELETQMASVKESVSAPVPDFSSSERFYSPLVKNIAKEENVSMDELEAIVGTGKEGRVTKNDIMAYLENLSNGSQEQVESKPQPEAEKEKV
ncbi:MAG TPA: biotin/lipoyl-containing protein, partial [Allomuricauda sp.]|nr:biotin/lipoyl-containing protein [Allomuricauda sp.]